MFCYINRTYCFCCKKMLYDDVIHFCRETNCETLLIRSFYGNMCVDCIQRNCNNHTDYFRCGWYRCNDIEIPPIQFQI